MGIGTRNYAKPYTMGGGLPPGIKWLLIANVAIFLLQFFGGNGFLLDWFALRPADLFSMFAVWQLATYMFLHGGISHILFNMLALWMFGKELEQTWGTERFLRFYFFCGIGAGLCVVLANYLLPGGNPAARTLGASGAIYGIMLASAVLWPDRIVYLQMLFPIKMKYLVMIYGAIAFLSSFDMNSGVSNVAHLGGLLFGWLYLKTPRVKGVSFLGALQDRYKRWQFQRNKRRFQVYMKKKDGKDPFTH
jgi:membrane associated rhomboid family serine protease